MLIQCYSHLSQILISSWVLLLPPWTLKLSSSSGSGEEHLPAIRSASVISVDTGDGCLATLGSLATDDDVVTTGDAGFVVGTATVVVGGRCGLGCFCWGIFDEDACLKQIIEFLIYINIYNYFQLKLWLKFVLNNILIWNSFKMYKFKKQ